MSFFAPIDTGIAAGDITLMQNLHEVFPYNEVIRILWGGEWFYYANRDFDFAPMSNIFGILGAVTINVRLPDKWHAEFKMASIIEDTDSEFEFWDDDDHFRSKHRIYGEGARIEVYGYWPDMTVGNANGMLRCLWWGLLGQPEKSDPQIFRVKAKAGTRSPKLDLPRRIIYPGCSRVFGGQTNPATGLPFLTTQEQINDHACPYNRHLGGAPYTTGTVGLLNGGVPFTSCPRNSLAACADRLGPTVAPKYYGGFDLIQAVSAVPGRRGHTYYAASNANPSIIRDVIGVTYGIAVVGELEPLVWRHIPGHTQAVWPVSEGPIQGSNPQWGIFFVEIDGKWIIQSNTGKQQGVYGADYMIPGLTHLGYSKTAYFHTTLPDNDFPDFDPTQSKASCLANGLNEIRQYTAPGSYVLSWTNNRAWCFFDLLTSKTFGHGYDRTLFEIDDWINLAAFHNQVLLGPDQLVYDYSVDPPETTYVPTYRKRCTLNVHLRNRKAQEVIKDICSGGNMGAPFFWNGKIRIVGLGLQDVVSEIPQVFTTEAQTYGFRNIKQGSLEFTQKSVEELTNVLEVKFTEQQYPVETGSYIVDGNIPDGVPPLFVEQTLVYDDQLQQLKVGLSMGDTSLFVTKQSFDAFGVANYHEAVRIGAIVFDLGEQERGGLANNLTASFTTWFPSSDGIQLHPYKIIEIKDVELQQYEETPGKPFKYFRILNITRKGDLTLQVEAQAYPLEYYKAIEDGNYIRPLPVITRGITAPRLPQKIPRPNGLSRNRTGLTVGVRS